MPSHISRARNVPPAVFFKHSIATYWKAGTLYGPLSTQVKIDTGSTRWIVPMRECSARQIASTPSERI
jgi:hypothetical protein